MVVIDVVECESCGENWGMDECDTPGQFECPNCPGVWLQWEPDLEPDYDAIAKDMKIEEVGQ